MAHPVTRTHFPKMRYDVFASDLRFKQKLLLDTNDQIHADTVLYASPKKRLHTIRTRGRGQCPIHTQCCTEAIRLIAGGKGACTDNIIIKVLGINTDVLRSRTGTQIKKYIL